MTAPETPPARARPGPPAPRPAAPPSSQPAARRRRRRRALLLALAALLTVDLLLPPQRQGTARILLAGIDLYQATLSPVLASSGVRCRFTPSCSRYAEGAIRKYGTVGGLWRSAWRLARCGPWTPPGTVDPP